MTRSRTIRIRWSSGGALVFGASVLLTGCIAGVATGGKADVAISSAHAGSSAEPILGWYTDEKTGVGKLAAYERAGVNVMLAYHDGEPYTSRWLEAAQAHHMRVLLQPAEKWVGQGDLAGLRSFVERYRKNPAVYGWYLYDEPDMNQLPPAALVAAYRTIKAVDDHPVAVVFTEGQCLFGRGTIDPRYLGGFDLLMFDRYPFYANAPRFDIPRDVRLVTGNCARMAREHHKLGPVMVLQGFGKGMRDGPFRWRDPTYAESICQVRAASAAGASGILFYSDQYADGSVWRNTDSIIHSIRERRLGSAPSQHGC